MPNGCIHGRFQPFHNGHLEYFRAAASKSGHVTIGLTEYEPDLKDEESPGHRKAVEANPFTYWQRKKIIEEALKGEGVGRSTFDFCPFPIHCPVAIANYLDPKTIMYTTIVERWNISKIERLRKAGFFVEILWERDFKEFDGARVRQCLRENSSLLAHMLPSGAIDITKLFFNERRKDPLL